MIINSVLPSVGGAIEKIRIKPFARSLRNYTTGWVSNDPDVINQHGSITITASNKRIAQTASPSYQLISYYEMVAVYENGREVDLRLLANAGAEIKAQFNSDLTYTGSATANYPVGNITVFNGNGGGSWGTHPVTCPEDISTYSILDYDDGTARSIPGCFIYISAMSGDSQATPTATMILYSVTINGISYPIELSTDWGDR